MRKTMKLTPALLRRIVLEERRRMLREAAVSDPIMAGDEHPEDVEATEIEASDLAGTIAHDVDFMKALKIKEHRLQAQLRKIQEAKTKVRRRVAKKLG